MKPHIVAALLWPLLVLGCLYLLIRYWWAVVQNPPKALDMAEAVDVAANVALNGQPYTTISARAARACDRGARWGKALCTVLDAIDPNHCQNAKGDP